MISLHLPQDFLVQMAHEKGLSPEQMKVLILRFSDQKEYSEIAAQLNTSSGACLKRMGQVYRKFGVEGEARGKEGKLQKNSISSRKQELPSSPRGNLKPLSGRLKSVRQPYLSVPLSVRPARFLVWNTQAPLWG